MTQPCVGDPPGEGARPMAASPRRSRHCDKALARADRRRHPLRSSLPAIIALVAVASLVLAVDPRAIASAGRRFDLALAIPLLALAVVFYALQGLRWHLLLRGVGIRLRLPDSELVNLSGQTVTAALPLGDLNTGRYDAASAVHGRHLREFEEGDRHGRPR